MNYEIREMHTEEYPLLSDFLYEAIFQRDITAPLSRSVIEDPALQVYIKDFGSLKDDYCLCAVIGEKPVGAVWVRNIEGYGSIDENTPEFAISLYKEYRGCGIGTELMKRMLEALKNRGYESASLSVQKDNYAAGMYRKLGFVIIGENEEEYIMEYCFQTA